VAGAGDGAFTGGEHRTSTRATRSGYIATPALTWGALQLQRPHALSGSLFSSRGLARGECSRASRQPFEANGMGGDGISIISIASDAARHGPVVFTGTGIPVELSLSLDRDVMSERVMRTGAFLVQRGPVCAESLFFMASWTWVSADQTAVTTSW
jgi:hypothetical protein